MRLGCCLLLIVFFPASMSWAETWMVQSASPEGEVRISHWEVKASEDGIEYFLKGETVPAYTLYPTPSGSLVKLKTGMTRSFSPGFLLLMDLPLPVFLPGGNDFEGGQHCFQEYVGRTTFRSCINVIQAVSHEQIEKMSVGLAENVVLVIMHGELEMIISQNLLAKRIN